MTDPHDLTELRETLRKRESHAPLVNTLLALAILGLVLFVGLGGWAGA